MIKIRIYVNIKFGNSVGNEWQIGNGARQGGVLSSLIYSIYVNGVLEEVKSLPVILPALLYSFYVNGLRQEVNGLPVVLSALLYSFYANGLPGEVNDLPAGCNLGTIIRTCYADDVVLLAPSTEGLQIMIDKACSMLQDLKLIVNMKKTVNSVFKKKANLIINSVVYWSGRTVKRVQQWTYLGVIF